MSADLSRFARRTGLVLVAVLLVAGCGLFGGGGGNDAATGGAGGVLHTEWLNFPTLDPQVVTNGMWYTEQGLLEGLVQQNAKGTGVIPATADRWQKSSDGLTYTFHIRDTAKWSNGRPVTAKDFEWTYRRLLNPHSAGAGVQLGNNSYIPTLGIKGDVDYQTGKIKDWAQVGVKAVDTHTLTFTLARPNSAFLIGLTHPSMLPLDPQNVQKYPKNWQQPAHWVGNGPFVLDQWKLNSSTELVPNKQYWDKKNVHLSAVKTQLLETNPTAVSYRNGEVDVMSLSDAAATREFQQDPKLTRAIRSAPSTTTGYLGLLHSKNKALQDVRVRKALLLGLDRKAVAKTVPGTRAALTRPPDWLPGWSSDIGTPIDIAAAKKLLAEAGYPGGKGLPTIRILVGAPTSPALDAIVDVWQKDLGIKVKADVVEAGVYVQKRFAPQPASYAGFYYGTFGMIQPTWAFVDGNLWGPQYMQEFSMPPQAWPQYQKVQNDSKLDPAKKVDKLAALRDRYASAQTKQYATLVKRAENESDPAKQQQLYLQAAKASEQSYLDLPIFWSDKMVAVRPTVQGLNVRTSFEDYYLKGVRISGS
ncbi:MAG: peptide ABC transporter substrate-binding protein [Actinoallomurus sp.]